MLRAAARVAGTEAEGPGLRYALWVQGCPFRCAGCCNPLMLDFEGGEIVTVSEIVDEMLAAPGIEGVTLLGGEPFAQARPLAAIAARARGAGLGVMTFTGYRIEELRQARCSDWEDLLASTDLLVDGRYEREQASVARRWIGSDNQRVHVLTDRYRHLEGGWDEGSETVEVRIAGRRVFVNGHPDTALAEALTARLHPGKA